jgi:hypothetical protein
MEPPVMPHRFQRCAVTLLLAACLFPALASAQSTPSEPSRMWATAGAAFLTVQSHCQTCEEDAPYRHDTAIIGNAGYRANARMDVGAEIAWMPVDTPDRTINTTHLNAIAQFRPCGSKGFFVKGGAGMAFVRNWEIAAIESINQKALSVMIGGGWAFRRDKRVGFQVFASQHVAALGDLQTAAESVPDVVGNFWSLGASIVFR